MSLILDALKKSEAERQRGQVPNVLSPPPITLNQIQTQKKPLLPWLILLALVIAALAFGYFYTKTPVAGSPSAVLAPTTQMVKQTDKPVPTNIAPPIVVVTKPAPIEKPIPPSAVTSTPLSAAPLAPAELPPASPTIADSEFATRIASLSEMPTEQRQQLPALKLSMHVYSSDTSKRFAIIDGQRVNEGSVLGTAVLEQIRQDGVVLSVQGQSYLLPRP